MEPQSRVFLIALQQALFIRTYQQILPVLLQMCDCEHAQKQKLQHVITGGDISELLRHAVCFDDEHVMMQDDAFAYLRAVYALGGASLLHQVWVARGRKTGDLTWAYYDYALRGLSSMQWQAANCTDVVMCIDSPELFDELLCRNPKIERYAMSFTCSPQIVGHVSSRNPSHIDLPQLSLSQPFSEHVAMLKRMMKKGIHMTSEKARMLVLGHAPTKRIISIYADSLLAPLQLQQDRPQLDVIFRFLKSYRVDLRTNPDPYYQRVYSMLRRESKRVRRRATSFHKTMPVSVPHELSQIMLDYWYKPPSDDPGTEPCNGTGLRRWRAPAVGGLSITASDSDMVRG